MNNSEISYEQELPASIAIEKALLGSILLDGDLLWQAGEDLTTTDYVLDSHQRIYSAMLRIAEDGKTIDILTLLEEIGPAVQSVGGASYIFSLTEGLPRKLSIAEWVKIVKEKSTLRQIIKKCSLLMTQAYDQGDPMEILSRMQGDAIEIAAEGGAESAVHVAAVTQEVIDRIERQMIETTQNTALGLTTGLEPLDVATKGLFPAEYSIIGGESGGGKTSLLTQILVANALKRVPVGMFSIEMKKAQVVSRMFSSVNESFTASQIRDPRLISLYDKKKLKSVRSAIDSLPIWIDDTARISLDKLKARARAMIRKHNIKLLGVDYLQLILAALGTGKISPDQVIQEATFGLRDLAKEENIHIVALSQYSRDTSIGRVKKGGRQRLKGSSAIEQSAQNIFLIEADDPKDGEEEVDAQITIDKQREGGRKKIKCRLSFKHLTFKPEEVVPQEDET
jgi:replicative DNA helicase